MRLLFLIIFLAILLILFGIFLYTLYRLRKSLNIRVSANTDNATRYKNLNYQTRYFRSADGIKIASWYLPVKNPKAIIILTHGYKIALGGKPLMLGHAEYLQKFGYSALLIDLRSVGQSEGNKISLGVKEWKDAVAAYDYVKSLPENNNKKIGFFGISMGAATCIIASGESGKGDFVIASVPFASYRNLFLSQIQRENLPVFLLPFLRLAALLELGFNYNKYAPITEIKKIHSPVFIISAKEDEEVLNTDGEDLYTRANQPKKYWQANTPHDVFKYNAEEFQKQIVTFLDRITSF